MGVFAAENGVQYVGEDTDMVVLSGVEVHNGTVAVSIHEQPRAHNVPNIVSVMGTECDGNQPPYLTARWDAFVRDDDRPAAVDRFGRGGCQG